MKKLLIIAVLLFSGVIAHAQIFTFGPKGGVKITGVNTNFSDYSEGFTYEQFTKGGQMNFTGGAFARLKISKFFVQPEVMWYSDKYSVSGNQHFISFKVNHLNVPVLFGIKPIKPLNIMAGPVMSKTTAVKAKNLNGQWEDVTDGEGETWGYQVGIGLELGRIMIDLRYEDNLDKFGDQIQLGDQTFQFDERQNAVELTMAYKIFK